MVQPPELTMLKGRLFVRHRRREKAGSPRSDVEHLVRATIRTSAREELIEGTHPSVA